MMSQRNVSIFSIAVLSFVLLFQFQNCAPAHPQSSSSSAGGETRIIDDFNKTELQFAVSDVQLNDQAASADVSGLCNRQHNGAKLKWAIWAADGQVLFNGDALCNKGQFDLQLTGIDQMVCGVTHQLVVQGDWGGSAYVQLQRRCEPLASEAMAVPAGMPGGTQCSLEYVLTDQQQSPCSQVCYRQGQVVSQAFVDRDQCSGLAARLAGP